MYTYRRRNLDIGTYIIKVGLLKSCRDADFNGKVSNKTNKKFTFYGRNKFQKYALIFEKNDSFFKILFCQKILLFFQKRLITSLFFSIV